MPLLKKNLSILFGSVLIVGLPTAYLVSSPAIPATAKTAIVILGLGFLLITAGTTFRLASKTMSDEQDEFVISTDAPAQTTEQRRNEILKNNLRAFKSTLPVVPAESENVSTNTNVLREAPAIPEEDAEQFDHNGAYHRAFV
jgi:hypothetical protein